MSASWYDIRNVTDKAAEVAIYDEIGHFGVTAKAFSDSIQGLGNRRLTVRIHSPGGEIFEGSAVYNALRRHKGGVDVAIDGLAASMASIIAMAGEKRSMAENAMLMIHNPWTATFGEASDLRKEADLLDTLKEVAISAYAGRTKLPRAKLSEMMDAETWMTAEEAKENGFVTDITEPLSMKNSARRFDISRFSNTPKSLMDSAPVSEELPEPEAKIEDEIILELDEESTKELLADHFEELKAAYDEHSAAEKALSEAEKEALVAGFKAQLLAKDDVISVKDAQIAAQAQTIAALESMHGVAPAKVIVPAPLQPESRSIVEHFLAMPDGPARTAFYNKHSQEILQSVQKA